MKKHSPAEAIRSVGFRATAPRVALLSLLERSKYPQSIQTITKQLGKGADQVTVYRVLGAFTKAGLVREVDLRQGKTYYERADGHDHHHVVCTSCQKVEDFTGCEAERLAQKALRQTKSFAKVTGHSFELFGLCNSCVKRLPTLASH